MALQERREKAHAAVTKAGLIGSLGRWLQIRAHTKWG
jgi:hypothetical protein